MKIRELWDWVKWFRYSDWWDDRPWHKQPPEDSEEEDKHPWRSARRDPYLEKLGVELRQEEILRWLLTSSGEKPKPKAPPESH